MRLTLEQNQELWAECPECRQNVAGIDGHEVDCPRSPARLAIAGVPTSITDCRGESRPVTRLWADGSWQCPFCGHPVAAARAEKACQNPWCSATVHAFDAEGKPKPEVAERFRELAEKHAREKAERERRERDTAAALERRRLEDLERVAFHADAYERMRQKGACPRCARFEFHGRRVELVRHRRAENCPEGFRDPTTLDGLPPLEEGAAR